jgi:hypothetical protein
MPCTEITNYKGKEEHDYMEGKVHERLGGEGLIRFQYHSEKQIHKLGCR